MLDWNSITLCAQGRHKVKQNNRRSMLSSASPSHLGEQFRGTPQEPDMHVKIHIILRTAYPRWKAWFPVMWDTTLRTLSHTHTLCREAGDAQHLVSCQVSCNTKGGQVPTLHGSNYAQFHNNSPHPGTSWWCQRSVPIVCQFTLNEWGASTRSKHRGHQSRSFCLRRSWHPSKEEGRCHDDESEAHHGHRQ